MHCVYSNSLCGRCSIGISNDCGLGGRAGVGGGFGALQRCLCDCKDVYVKVTNNTGSKIKIIDLDYYDYGIDRNGAWRSEPIKNEVIDKEKIWQATRRLENVKAEQTRIRMKYRIKKRVAYSAKIHKSKKSPKKLCMNGTKFEFNLK